MEVRMKGRISGTRNGEDWPQPGETIDLPEAEARQLIAQGMAAEADDDEVGEPENTAAPDASEKRPARSRKGVITKE